MGPDDLGGLGGHAVLQLCELVGPVGWDQVGARREDLRHLDKRWSETLDRPAQPHGLWIAVERLGGIREPDQAFPAQRERI
ncbi:MAG: hypothetical protein AAF235_04075, partial [Planctomycetota bacterium]